jgi:hypothetical protein
MRDEVLTVERASRRAYELGRLSFAVRHALLATVAVALLSGLMVGRRALVWVPVSLVVITFTEWRGLLLMTGARRGLLAGLASMFLPLSLLRPCCGIDAKAMDATCCVMPSACWAVGVLVGFGMALLLPKAPPGRGAEAAFGMMLGVLSVAIVRCSMLFVGEAVGLLGGMTAGIVAASLAHAGLHRIRATQGS